MELEEVDLNHLVVFQHLLAERSVTRAAEALGLSQPTVSNTLARLRKLLGDELFLRTPAGMQPTPFAEQLAESVSFGLAAIHGALNQRATFDPAASRRAFCVEMTDIGDIYFLPLLAGVLRRQAPGVTLRTHRAAPGSLRDDMEAGRVDLAIGLLPVLQAGFFQRQLFTQRYVCLFRRGHPLAGKGKLTVEAFTAADHLLVVSPGTGHGEVDEILRRSGIERRVVLTVPHFVAVGHILQATDLVATVPERFAQRMIEPFGLATSPHPVTLPEVAINVFWHAKFHREPGNRWLRGLIAQQFGS